MGNAYTYRMPVGVPGDVTRPSQSTIEAHAYGATPFTAYGLPVKLSAGKVIPMGAGDAAQQPLGFLARPFPTQGANASDPLGTAVPPTSGVANLLKRGYITVKNNVGTPALNGVVYMRVTANGGNTIIGGIEATSDGGNTIALAGCTFNGAADADGNVEIAFNI
jgi:hypothetical protein